MAKLSTKLNMNTPDFSSNSRKKKHPNLNTYSQWDGSQSGFDLTAKDILDSMSDDLMSAIDINKALQRIIRNGLGANSKDRVDGLKEMMKKIKERRREILEQNDLGGIYDEIVKELEDVVETEKDMLERMEKAELGDSDEIAEKKQSLSQLPEDLPSKMNTLSNHEFMSEQAEAKFKELLEKLESQLVKSYLKNISQAMSELDTERLKDMLSDLNKMLEAKETGDESDFESFMDEYGDMFGENPPKSLDELLKGMAQSMAAMSAMWNSMNSEQRKQLQNLASQMLADMDLDWQLSRLSGNLQNMFENLNWDSAYDFEGDQAMDMPSGADIFSQLGELENLEQQLANSTTPADLEEIDEEQVKKLLGEEDAKNLKQLEEIAKQLEEAGFVIQKEEGLVLSPKAINYLGKKVLGDIMKRLQKDRMGAYDADQVGVGHEREYDTKPYEWGDPFNLNIERTIRNALTRKGAGVPVSIEPEDFEVERTQKKVQNSTVLMLDLSLSMEVRSNFTSAKKVAIALHSLISSKYPRDYLGIVGFSWAAKEIKASELIEAGVDWLDHGTNMEHGLKIARSMLSRQTGNRQIIMITDGEPTAHLDQNGAPQFYYPPTKETIDKTLAEVLRATRDKIVINIFMLDAYPGLKRFIEYMTKMNGGRAFFTTPETLGEYLISDFVGKRSA